MRLIALFFIALSVTACTQNQKYFASFTEWCEQKATLPKERKRTVEILLEKAGTQNCIEANQKFGKFHVRSTFTISRKFAEIDRLSRYDTRLYQLSSFMFAS
ncbi:MAG: hypothetical protein ACFCUV_02595 [Rivularia sp. (in: cyanobacteria)]